MFESGIIVKNFIDNIISETDVALPIPNETWLLWLNSLQQMLYSNIVKEQKEIQSTLQSNPIVLSELSVDTGESKIDFDDIYTVYQGSRQLIKTSITGGKTFSNCYFKVNNNLGYNVDYENEITIIYFVKPSIITTDSWETDTIKVPYEFLDMVSSKLRGEAYLIENEFGIASYWMSKYNAALDNFKQQVNDNVSQFGM